MTDRNAPVENSPYSEDELQHFEELLQQQKKESQEEIESLKDSVQDLSSTEDDTSSSQTHHSGNIGSEEEEKETLFTLIEKEKQKLAKIDAALDRIENGTYGVCQKTGQKIQKERLEAIPYAEYCVQVKKE